MTMEGIKEMISLHGGAILRRTLNGQSKRHTERYEEKACQITERKKERKTTKEEGTVNCRTLRG